MLRTLVWVNAGLEIGGIAILRRKIEYFAKQNQKCSVKIAQYEDLKLILWRCVIKKMLRKFESLFPYLGEWLAVRLLC
jgi:hypothetical protein